MSQNSNIAELLGKDSVVVLCKEWNNDQVIQEISKTYFGLDTFEKMNQLVQKEDYTTILKHLWTEKNHEKKLAWLRSVEKAAHPILLFEQAIEELHVDQSPSAQDRALVLLGIVTFRMFQDSSCFKKSPTIRAIFELNDIFSNRLDQTFPHLKMNDCMKGFSKERAAQIRVSMLEKFKQIAEDMQASPESFPSPNWIKPLSMPMADPNTYNAKRIRVGTKMFTEGCPNGCEENN